MIRVLKNISDLDSLHNERPNKTLGFVPTMGNLHQGHLSLLVESLKENDISIISIYVNPTQFGAGEDLDAYPRTFEEDCKKIEDISKQFQNKEVYIFFPENNEVIYPKDFNDYISIPKFNSVIEGEVRPTHFDGVATVVKRLFKIIRPTKAYFGKKDYQQLRLVQELVQSEKLNIEVIGLPIIREQDGLAMSSRNLYLDKKQRTEALDLSKKLIELAHTLKIQGLEQAQGLAKNTLKSDSRFNYLEIRKQNDLSLPSESDSEFVLLGNLQLGTTRLLDNIEVSI